MQEVRRRVGGFTLVLLMLAQAVSAEQGPATAPKSTNAKLAELFPDPVIVRGKGVEVKRSQLEDAFVTYRANLAARDQSIPEEQRPLREAQLLDRLIVTQLLSHRATAEDKAKAKEVAAKFMVDARKAAFSEETFSRQLKALGLSPEQFEARVLEQALAETVLERELKSTLTVSKEQVEDLYKTGSDLLVNLVQADLDRLAKDSRTTVGQLNEKKRQVEELKKSNLARLENPEKVRIVHLFISTRNPETEQPLPPEKKLVKLQLIERLLRRARSGEDFAKLVTEFSEDRGLKETKGEYTFTRDDRFSQEFKAAAFSLGPNQISDIVTASYGYHIIKLLEKIPAKKLELEKVSADLKELLRQQGLQRQMPEYFVKLKKEAGIEIFDSRYRMELPKDVNPLKPSG